MSNVNLAVILSLQDQFSKSLGGIKNNIKGLSNSVKQSFNETNAQIVKTNTSIKTFGKSFRENYFAITATLTASILALNKAFTLVKLSATFKQQEEAFNNLARSFGVDANKMVQDLKKLSANTLSTSQVMQQASKAMILGLSPDQLPRLMEIARSSARAFGADVSFMFDSIVLGIGRQSKMILDNLGIIVKAEDAYEKYARTLGVAVDKLSDLQKRQAFANAVMIAGENIIRDVNIQMVSELEYLQSLTSAWEDFKIKSGSAIILFVKLWLLQYNFFVSSVAVIIETIAKLMDFMIKSVSSMIKTIDKVISKIKFIDNPLRGISSGLDLASKSTSKWSKYTGEVADKYSNTVVQLAKIIQGENESVLNMARLKDSANKVNEEFIGWGKSFEELVKGAKVTSEKIKDALVSSVDIWSDAMGSAFAGMLFEGQSFAEGMKQAFKQMASTFIAQVSSMIAKWLAFLALKSIAKFFGFFHDGGVIEEKHSGGMIRAHNGLAVDEVPIIAQTGEGILSRRGMQNLGGASVLNDLNNGGGSRSAGGNININIYNPKMTSREEAKSLASLVGIELERQLRYARSG